MDDETHRLIAVRRSERRGSRARRPTGATARALRHELHAFAGASLEDIGLEEVAALDQRPSTSDLGRFRELAGIDTVIVDPFRGTTADDVRDRLGDEYLVMPDIEFELPDAAAQDQAAVPIPAGALRPRSEVYATDTGVLAAHAEGNLGAGAVLAVFDTGVDADHAEFAGQIIDFGYAPPGGGAVRDNRRGFDTATHGTHVCGTLHGRELGIAPQADLLVASVIESERLTTSASRVIEAMHWLQNRCGDPRYDDKPVILSMSLGFKPDALSAADMSTTMEALRTLLLDLLVNDGILPIVAIGNDGEDTVRAPGYYPETLAVGAVTYERVPWFKSGGGNAPAPFADRICPDLAGFGVDVISCTGRDPQGVSWYGKKSGTSMATPYVAGVAALVAAKRGIEGEQLRTALLEDALALPGLASERVGGGLARYA